MEREPLMGGRPLTFTAYPNERPRTVAMFLVGVAPQWLVIGRSARAIGVGLAVLVAVLLVVELNLRWCARCGATSSRSHRIVAALTPRPLARRLLALAAFVALAGLLMSRYGVGSVVWVLYIAASLLIGAVCWTTLVWMVNAWRNPGAFDETRLPAVELRHYHSFSLIVPARHEESVLEATLSRLLQTEHPAFEVIVVVGADDLPTAEVADRVATAHPDRVRVVVDHSWPKNKPKALNTALPHCRGEITGVFDAEDDVHPDLISRVDQCFQTTGADIVQAGVQLTNLHSSWFSLRNALEYYFWFRSRLHFHARVGFIPLGGNTVFVRSEVLREVNGWDAECLAEDCELGVRLSSMGAKTVVFYEPELVTREETPPTLRAFVRQRTRWNQGYLQTLSRGHWRRLPFRQRALGQYTLAMPYLMALAWVMIPAAIATAVAVTAPVPITLLLFLPVLPLLTVLAVEAAGLGDMCRSCGERATPRDYARLVLGLPVYQVALAFASARAVVREARGARGWEKTAHFGLHRTPTDVEHERLDGSATPVPQGLPRALYSASAAGESHPTALRSGPVASVALRTIDAPTTRSEPDLDGPAEALAFSTVGGRPNGRAHGNGNGNGAVAMPNLVRGSEQPLWVRLRSRSANGSNGGPKPHRRPPDQGAHRRVERKRGTSSARLRASRADIAVLVPLLLAVGAVQVVNFQHWPASFFDEGTYVANAWAVGKRGALSNYTYGYGHPPLGWLVMSLWTWATSVAGSVYSVAVERQLMVTMSIASCWLLYVLARRLGMGRPFAAIAVLLFGLSPLALYFHRLVLIDNPAVTFALAAFVLALSPRRRLWTFAASGACFAASVLSKESMLILLPVLALVALQNVDVRTRRYCLTFVGSFFVLVFLAYPLYAALKGELLAGRNHVSLVGEATVQLFTRKATGSVFDPRSQTYAIVRQWVRFDPWLLGAAALLSPLGLARRSTRAVTLAFLIQCLVVLRPGYLPYMYVIGILPFAALVVAGGAEQLWRVAAKGLRHHEPSARRWRALATRAGMRLAPVTRVVAALVLVGLVTACGALAAPKWLQTDRTALTTHLDHPELAAQRWLLRNVDHSKRLLVSDDFWIYLIQNGFDSHAVKGGFYSRTVVFYWPFDFDPAVKKLLPNGWKEFDYVVSTQGMRNDLAELPRTASAVGHSHVVVTFGTGDQRIEIRAVDRDQTVPPGPAVSAAGRP